MIYYGGQCNDGPDSFDPSSIAGCIINAVEMTPSQGSSGASCMDDMLCIGSTNGFWQFGFDAQTALTVSSLSINLFYPIVTPTMGGDENSSSCPSTFSYTIRFIKNGSTVSTYNGSIVADVSTNVIATPSSPISLATGDSFKVEIAGVTSNSNCDLFETTGASLLGCCSTGPNCTNFTGNATAVQPTCTTATGSATASASGGVSPYHYAWSNGSTSATISGVSPGTYTVVITDNQSPTPCSTTKTVTLTAPINCCGSLAGTITATQPTCTTPTGSASVSASGGTSPYSYSWSNGSSGTSISNVQPGTYNVIITDSSVPACSITKSITLSATTNCCSSLVGTISGVQPTCTAPTGSASISVSGGTSPYSYSWSNGSTASSLNSIIHQ